MKNTNKNTWTWTCKHKFVSVMALHEPSQAGTQSPGNPSHQAFAPAWPLSSSTAPPGRPARWHCNVNTVTHMLHQCYKHASKHAPRLFQISSHSVSHDTSFFFAWRYLTNSATTANMMWGCYLIRNCVWWSHYQDDGGRTTQILFPWLLRKTPNSLFIITFLSLDVSRLQQKLKKNFYTFVLVNCHLMLLMFYFPFLFSVSVSSSVTVHVAREARKCAVFPITNIYSFYLCSDWVYFYRPLTTLWCPHCCH